MLYLPIVNTTFGAGRLFRIEGENAIVEFDFLFLVELPLSDVDLDGVDLTNVEVVDGGASGE